MLVFWKQRLVMLAVPKTGSSAYAEALAPIASLVVRDPPELKHAPVYRYNRFFRPMFEKVGAPEMDTMAVVREPLSWLGSWYRYRQRPFLDGKPTSTRGISFDTFVRAYCEKDRPPFAEVGQQSKFVEPRPNGLRVTHLFRYEDQDAIRAFLEERLGQTIDVPRVNVSGRAALELEDATRALFLRRHAADVALWETAGAGGAPG